MMDNQIEIEGKQTNSQITSSTSTGSHISAHYCEQNKFSFQTIKHQCGSEIKASQEQQQKKHTSSEVKSNKNDKKQKSSSSDSGEDKKGNSDRSDKSSSKSSSSESSYNSFKHQSPPYRNVEVHENTQKRE